MKNRPDKEKTALAKTHSAASPPSAKLSDRRQWLFRFLATVIFPLALLGGLEAVLRLAGFGYPTAFLLSAANEGKKTWVQNNQFSVRFFGQRMARLPHPISIPQDKPPGTVRIFVFGESAAFGDPLPAFGLPRLLEAMLNLRHPATKFEVVNAAMTAINSHVILPIARDCARANGDIWVVYMGNNEVVGPFGAGTVFGSRAAPWPQVRAQLALKATRTGQLLGAFQEAIRPPPPDKSEWGGMVMFLNQQVCADDRQMEVVYGNCERNLSDILAAGRDAGAGIVLSTVAVNLKDCAPFASEHRRDLSASELAEWEGLCQSGVAAQQAGQPTEAIAQFQAAARIDDRFAELRFRWGQAALALGDAPGAQTQFAAARDLDALRFRCDSRLNALIRRSAANRSPEKILLADAEQEFAAHSADGLPGQELFYEHVHLTFEGNYLLARVIAEQVERLLPPHDPAPARPWPSPAGCARRLGWTDHDLQLALTEILSRLSAAPFTHQFNHTEQLRGLVAAARKDAANISPAQVVGFREAALAAWPNDALLGQQLAEAKRDCGDFAGAEAAARRSLELLPSNAEGWSLLGQILVKQQKFEAALGAYRRAFALNSQDVWSLQNQAVALGKLNRAEESERAFRRALALKPRFGLAWIGLGQLLEAKGCKDEAADCFQRALTNRTHRADDLATLARFCAARGWLEAASTNYADAIALSPADARLRFEAGRNFASLNRHADAAASFLEAAQLAPEWGEAHFLAGLELGGLEKPAEAERSFREAVRLMPELLEARVNLGIALVSQKKYAQALAEFQAVLQRSPTNELAQEYIQALREPIRKQTEAPAATGHDGDR